MKKFLLSIAVLVGLSAAAQTFAVGDLNYTVTGTATVEVSGLANSTATSIDVPATVENWRPGFPLVQDHECRHPVKCQGDQAWRIQWCRPGEHHAERGPERDWRLLASMQVPDCYRRAVDSDPHR